MTEIIIGLFYIFFNMFFSTAAFSVNILPSFIGYMFILLGLFPLVKESKRFKLPIVISFVLLAYRLVTYLIETFDEPIEEKAVMFPMEIIALILGAVLIYYIILGIEDIEERYNRNLHSSVLKGMFFVLFAIGLVYEIITAVYVLIYKSFSHSFENSMYNLILFILFYIAKFIFICCLFPTKKQMDKIEIENHEGNHL